MIDQLFGSKTRVKLLKLFYSNPNRSFYVREITRKIDEQINSVRRELANLLNIGIIGSDTTNNRLYYEINQKYDFYNPLSLIFGSDQDLKNSKTPTAANNSPNPLAVLGNVDLAVYTGQFTRDESSGTDILILGNVNKTQLDKWIVELEKDEGKELRYVLMTLEEFNYRRQIKDRFVVNLLNAKKQVIVDKTNIFKTE